MKIKYTRSFINIDNIVEKESARIFIHVVKPLSDQGIFTVNELKVYNYEQQSKGLDRRATDIQTFICVKNIEL